MEVKEFLKIYNIIFPDFLGKINKYNKISDKLQIRKIAEITSYNFYILLKDTIRSLVINHKYFFSFFIFYLHLKNAICFLLQKM